MVTFEEWCTAAPLAVATGSAARIRAVTRRILLIWLAPILTPRGDHVQGARFPLGRGIPGRAGAGEGSEPPEIIAAASASTPARTTAPTISTPCRRRSA